MVGALVVPHQLFDASMFEVVAVMLLTRFATMLLLLMLPRSGLCMPIWLLVIVLELMFAPPSIP